MELFEENYGMKGPPKATLARRAKSYSDFYEVAKDFLSKGAKTGKLQDGLEPLEDKLSDTSLGNPFEDFEEDVLNASQEEYQFVIGTFPVKR